MYHSIFSTQVYKQKKMSFDIFLLEFAEGGGFEPLLRRIKNQSIIFLTMR
jgi:hypothetical protein